MKKLEEIRVSELYRLLHDLKLPITVLQSVSDILHKTNKQEELEDYFYMLDRNIKYITRISASIKDTISKMDDENHNVFITDIVGYTEVLVDAIRAVCEIRNIDLIFQCEQDYVECNLNWRNYERILLNVLQNSLKHAKKCTKIKVVLKITNEKIQVKIYDDGKNCDEEGEVKEILKKGVEIKPEESSSGEGLFIITTLAKKLNASVEQTIDCFGMRFVLEIPNNDENQVIVKSEESYLE